MCRRNIKDWRYFKKQIVNGCDMENQLKINLYLSRVKEKLYTGLDTPLKDLNDFGISSQLYHDLGCAIDDVIQRMLINNKEVK